MPFTLTLTKKILILVLLMGSLLVIILNTPSKTEPKVKASVLPDFTQFTDVKAKKTAFFNYMLPFVNQANNEILAEREQIKALNFQNPSAKEQATLQSLLKKYRVETDGIGPNTRSALLKKVDIISPSLALAQAANESAWGTSRFAKEAYNFYGQWCFTKGCGLVPKQRSEGGVHEVKTFKSPYESVKGYMHNLNSHPLFKALRDERLVARQNKQTPSGAALAKGLIRYSERREAYIEEIRAMIRTNKLTIFDTK